VSDLNYEIEDRNYKMQVVHVNRLKQAYNFDVWKPRANQKVLKKHRRETPTDEEEDDEIKVDPFPLLQTTRQQNATEHVVPADRVPNTRQPVHQTVLHKGQHVNHVASIKSHATSLG
jgi:hypothetical protein